MLAKVPLQMITPGTPYRLLAQDENGNVVPIDAFFTLIDGVPVFTKMRFKDANDVQYDFSINTNEEPTVTSV